MSNQFEPYHKKQSNHNDFSAWKYQATKKNEEIVTVDEHEVFRAECERLRQEAIQSGYEQGLQQAQGEINEKKHELVRWLDLIKNPVQLLDEHVIQEVLQTILWISQHCIAVELSVNPEKLRDLLNQIKTELPTLSHYRVLAMHPEDVAWVQAEIGENELPGLHEIIVADPALARGDFYLKGEHSELDGRICTRLATIFTKYITKDHLIMPMRNQD